MNKRKYIVCWYSMNVKTEYDSKDEIIKFCCNNWSVSKIQVNIIKSGKILLTNKLGETFAEIGNIENYGC